MINLCHKVKKVHKKICCIRGSAPYHNFCAISAVTIQGGSAKHTVLYNQHVVHSFLNIKYIHILLQKSVRNTFNILQYDIK